MPDGVLRSIRRQQISRGQAAPRSPRRCPVQVQAPFASRSSCKWQSTDSGVLVQVLLSSQHRAWRLQQTGEQTHAVFPVERRAAACTMHHVPLLGWSLDTASSASILLVRLLCLPHPINHSCSHSLRSAQQAMVAVPGRYHFLQTWLNVACLG